MFCEAYLTRSYLDMSWLLILDNALNEDCAFLGDCWPVGDSGSILVTTRNACLTREFSVPVNMALGPIDDDSSFKILVKDLPEGLTGEVQEHARHICHRLGNLPLPLS
jgi:hypothetical protein